jgi:hypothetical protein
MGTGATSPPDPLSREERADIMTVFGKRVEIGHVSQ